MSADGGAATVFAFEFETAARAPDFVTGFALPLDIECAEAAFVLGVTRLAFLAVDFLATLTLLVCPLLTPFAIVLAAVLSALIRASVLNLKHQGSPITLDAFK
jgi:hypothetical protein